MDGTGKTTLVNRLSHELNLPIHERASTSVGGPVPNVYEWALRDVAGWDNQPLALYDRHPLVSEQIYGPVVRGIIDPNFHGDDELWTAFAKRVLVIFCDTSWDNVQSNLMQDEKSQMPGVMDNAKRLFLVYRTYARVFDGIKVRYDYDRPSSYNAVKIAVEQHIKWWESL